MPLPQQVHGPEWDVWASRLVDLKGVARPPEFNGEDSGWYEWKFRFQSVMSLLGILPAMRFVAELPYKVDFQLLSIEGQQKSTLLYNLL
eukprot:1294039-Heterocapsa_arctica.AAC.1